MITFEAIEERFSPRERGIVAVVIAAMTVFAWFNRFIQDDAFISFRYARNLSRGLGLVWNEGERVEGYTNFLWTLILALPFGLSIDPVAFSMATGLLLFPIGLGLVYCIAKSLMGSVAGGVFAVVLLGTNHTYSAFATGGLETQLHNVLLLGATAIVVARGGLAGMEWRSALLLSVCAAGALMTRMDSALQLVVLYGSLALEWLLDRDVRARPVRELIALVLVAVLPGAVLVLTWLGWKVAFYGDVLPNTYYAKMMPFGDSIHVGLRYLWTFVRSYWLWPLVCLPFVFRRAVVREWDRRVGILAVLALVSALYAVRIGGDFMEFRLLVPMLSSGAILLTWMLVRVSGRVWLAALAGVYVMVGSQLHAMTFTYVHGIESVENLNAHIEAPAQNWPRTGQVLDELFGDLEQPPLVAATASGAVPFYADLPTLDMLGLMDPWVARHGIRGDPLVVSPGHGRLATFEYMVDRGVNLVVGAPFVMRRDTRRVPVFGKRGLSGFQMETPARRSIPDEAVLKVLELPLDDTYRVFVLYLMPHAGIDRVIAERGIRLHRVQTNWPDR